jgi:GT2 family glycosyltransferase
LIRHDALLRVGGFNEAYRIADDTDWFLRARRSNLKCVVLDDVLVRKRIHAANISADTGTNSKELFKILRAAVHEKRTSGCG